MKLEIVLCLLVCQVSSLYEYDYGSEQDDSKSELAKHFTSNSDHYYIRPLQVVKNTSLSFNYFNFLTFFSFHIQLCQII